MIFDFNFLFEYYKMKNAKGVKKNKNWYERNVKFSKINEPEFIDILTNIKMLEKKIGFKISHKQKFIEFSPLTLKYLKLISKKIW